MSNIKSKRNDRQRANKVGKAEPARGAKLKEKTDQATEIQECGFFLIVNQVVTKKLRKNCKKIWWIGKVVVTLQRV